MKQIDLCFVIFVQLTLHLSLMLIRDELEERTQPQDRDETQMESLLIF